MVRLFAFLFLGTTTISALSLQEAEEKALSCNPQIKAAKEMVEKARYGHLATISRWLPQLQFLTEVYGTQKPLQLLQLSQRSAFLTQISLTQALLVSDLLFDVKISKFMQVQAAQLLLAAENDVLLLARAAYFRIALDQERLATAKEHVSLLQELSIRMEGFQRIGEATPYQVNQAKVMISHATKAYYEVLKDLKAHQDELVQILGLDPSGEYQFEIASGIDLSAIPMVAEKVALGAALLSQGDPFFPIVEGEFVQEENLLLEKVFSLKEKAFWTEIADQERPDVLLSKTIVSIAKERLKSSFGKYLPEIALHGGYGGGSTPYLELPSTKFDNQTMQWAAGLSLNWVVFDGLLRERRVKMAKAEKRAALFEAENVLQKAHKEVREQVYGMESALAKYVTAEASLKLAKQTLQQASNSLGIGYVTVYEYLISVDGVIRAKTLSDDAKYQLLLSYFQLLHACGRRG